MQGLEAHGRISPTGFHGEKLWCPGLRRRESVELSNCSASVRAWAMQTIRRWRCRWPCTGRQPFGSLLCAGGGPAWDVWGQIVEASVHDLRL